MDYLYYRAWRFPGVPSIVDEDLYCDLYNQGFKKALIIAPEEMPALCPDDWPSTEKFKHLAEYLKQSPDIQVDFVTANALDALPQDYLSAFDCHFWPTYWINRTFAVLHLQRNSIPPHEQDLKYKFICLNKHSHTHRQMMIDYLAKYDLIKNNLVSWLDQNNHNGYIFKYWQKEILKIEDEPDVNYVYAMPKKINQALFNLVTETACNQFFLTEKTAKPLLCKQPFVVLGSAGFNQQLTSLGFELYTELFDYSFDSEPDVETRCNKLAEMISQIPDSLNDLRMLVKDKVEHNYNRAREIALNNLYMPEILNEHIELINRSDRLWPETHLNKIL